MELRDFVTETLIQIVEGVEVAQRKIKTKNNGAVISPFIPADRELDKKNFIITHSGTGHIVEFDVAISVSQEKSDKKGIGLIITVVGMGMETKSNSDRIESSRIRFCVPVVLATVKNLCKG